MTDFTLTDGAPARSSSAVSWSAVLAGVAVAMATTFILFSLGASFGFAAASPWGDAARHAGAVGAMAAVWLVIVQWLASAIGGYLTGRLRTRWIGTHDHEVFFRDTAHGFITWATATVLVAGIAALAATGAANKAADTAATAAVPAYAYDADAIYRTSTGDVGATAAARTEAERILTAATVGGGLSPEDRGYLITSASARAGIDAAEASRRVDAAVVRERQAVDAAKQAADAARKAAAKLALLTALSLLVGAFIASVAAALGGQERDKHP
ncbi:MAG: hypothetical protein JWP35_571 [Caulobacter sp.]|nr:hypothetical protein [Caulobacter sp.]